MSGCSHVLYTRSIEELLSGRVIKEDRDDQQVRRPPVQMHMKNPVVPLIVIFFLVFNLLLCLLYLCIVRCQIKVYYYYLIV